MYRKILLAYDGSTFSDAVLGQGVALARLCGAELHLLSIVATSGATAIAEAFGPSDVLGFEQRELEQAVAMALQDTRKQGVTVTACVRIGDPAVAIVEYAREIHADLIVLGHSSKGVLSRWLQGSVGAYLLDHLPCSLLVATGGA